MEIHSNTDVLSARAAHYHYTKKSNESSPVKTKKIKIPKKQFMSLKAKFTLALKLLKGNDVA